jgi:MFS family permease
MCLVFLLQYLDKQSLSYAGVFGLITDLKLTNSQYSWCSSIFYIGQLVAEYPFIYLMSRLPITKFVGATVILWGITCACLAAPQSYAGFAAVRFLLGFTEGAVSPAFVTITSIWYRKHEHALRTGLWVSMNGIAQVVGCLLMYGIGKNGSLPLAPWRTLFIICGALTIAAGIAFFILMPSGPQDAWFLSAREKQVLSLRMAHDREGGDKTSFSIKQLKETILDPKAWCAFWFGVLVTMQSPVLTFATLVINSIGYSQLQTMLYTAPSGAVQVALLWIGMLLCYILPRQRTIVVVLLCIPPIVGNILMLVLPLSAGWGVIVSAWLVSPCFKIPIHPLTPYALLLPRRWFFLTLTKSVTGLLHHRLLVHPPLTCRVKCKRQHEARRRQRHVFHRVLCRLHCISTTLDASAEVPRGVDYGACHVGSFDLYDDGL